MDQSAREITFTDGVCNFCIEYQKVEKTRRRDMLHPGREWTFYQIKKSKGYHCLLGLSGGVDSSTCLHYLIENEVKPLTFSVDNGWNDPKADENVMRMVESLKVPFQRVVLNLPVFRELQKAFILSGTRNVEIPTDHVLQALTYKMAAENGIKWIISGGNHSTEGIMPESYGYQPRDLRHIRAIYKRFIRRSLRGLPTISLSKYLYYRFIKGIKIINLLDFYEYDRGKAIKMLEEKYGYNNYGEKHEESKFTKWFQNVWLYRIHKIDKRRAHYSSMINSGQMTREEALKKLEIEPEPVEIKMNLGVENITLHDYKDYPTNEWIWGLASKIYGYFKTAKRTAHLIG
jgi:tRNA(Ile)-lysidine synthase TilS/MesJ